MKKADKTWQSGFCFPPEWSPHRATWLSWPHNPDTWPGGIESIYNGYLHFIKEISKHEQVCINVAGPEMELSVSSMLVRTGIDLSRIEFYHFPTNDAWCRDHGPCFLVHPDGRKIVIDWEYNAWGEKYPPYEQDNAIPGKIAAHMGLEIFNPGLVLEGGSVEFNGAGTVLTTTKCLLNPNRNPGISSEIIEENLQQYFGVSQVLWLEQGIAGDDTDGHIDTIARFIDPQTIVTVVEEDPGELNYLPLQENYKKLSEMKLLNGSRPEVVTLPMPEPRFNLGQRLPASYANFYICNGSVLVPTYRDAKDQEALSILKQLFTGRQVVGIDCLEIIRGLGGLHCLCMQEPSLPKGRPGSNPK
jgi:agmatine deiminase